MMNHQTSTLGIALISPFPTEQALTEAEVVGIGTV